MTYIIFEIELFENLINGIGSKTVIILNYLIEQARKHDNNMALRYKDIENALNLSRTTVGKNMRFLMKIGAIERIDTGIYKINNNLINIQTVEREL